MRYSAIRIIATVIAINIFFGCKKTDNITPSPPPPPAPIMVTASVSGRITGLDNAAINNAVVEAGTTTTTTDANGQFTLKNVQLDKDAGFVKVTKAGYFTGSRTFLVNANTTNNIINQLIPKTVSGNIASSSGGNVDVAGGVKINFAASSFVNAGSNTAYAGDVSVAGYYLNPADANFRKYMPGDLRGVSTANKEGILKSFGMLSVEMNDAGGQKLQLATGKTATITIPIPLAMQATAPATIPLWYFDEAKGRWKEEGTATKQATNYVGTVTHFSFWTAGQLEQSIRLDATFKDSFGNALDNKVVYITITGSNSTDSTANGTTEGYTNSAGTVSGLIPANTTLIMKVLDQYGVIYTQSIGPFNTDTNLGVITITNLITVTLSGTVVDCNNKPVTTGSVNVTIPADNYQFSSEVINGNFTTTFDRPNGSPTTATILVVDKSTANSATKVVTITSGNLNVGQINIVCSAPTPTVAGFSYSVPSSFVPVTVTFSNTSTNATSYLWDFGDGTTSSQQNPSHLYSTAGDYTVKLKATGPSNTDSTSKLLHLTNTTTDTYINLTLNGINYSWSPASDSLYGKRVDTASTFYTLILGKSPPNINHGNSISLQIFTDNNAVPGNYSVQILSTLTDTTYISSFPLTTNISEYGTVNGYITGTASGNMGIYGTATYTPFSLLYRVKRIQ